MNNVTITVVIRNFEIVKLLLTIFVYLKQKKHYVFQSLLNVKACAKRKFCIKHESFKNNFWDY